MVFLPRQQLLQLLYDRLHDKSRVHTDCRVETIQEGSTSVTVTTSNGAIFRGALVAGADGVRSRVRSAIAERCKATGLKTQLNNCTSYEFWSFWAAGLLTRKHRPFSSVRGRLWHLLHCGGNTTW